MTKFLTYCFVLLWSVMGFVELSNGDVFHTVTSFTIAAWNVSFINDFRKIEKAVKSDAEV